MNGDVVKCEDCDVWLMDPQEMGRGTCQLHPPRVFLVATPNGPMFMSSQPTTLRHGGGCADGKGQAMHQKLLGGH